MIANVIAFIAVATSAVLASPCGGCCSGSVGGCGLLNAVPAVTTGVIGTGFINAGTCGNYGNGLINTGCGCGCGCGNVVAPVVSGCGCGCGCGNVVAPVVSGCGCGCGCGNVVAPVVSGCGCGSGSGSNCGCGCEAFATRVVAPVTTVVAGTTCGTCGTCGNGLFGTECGYRFGLGGCGCGSHC